MTAPPVTVIVRPASNSGSVDCFRCLLPTALAGADMGMRWKCSLSPALDILVTTPTRGKGGKTDSSSPPGMYTKVHYSTCAAGNTGRNMNEHAGRCREYDLSGGGCRRQCGVRAYGTHFEPFHGQQLQLC